MANMDGTSTNNDLDMYDSTLVEGDKTDAGLTIRERLFVSNYLNTLDCRQAAIKAGYAPHMGPILTRRKRIRAMLDEHMRGIVMQPGEVLARLTAQARGTMGDVLDPAGNPSLETARETGAMANIKSVEYHEKTATVKKIVLHDAQAALVAMGKAHALFTDRQEIDTRVQISMDETRRTMRKVLDDPAALAAMIEAADRAAALGASQGNGTSNANVKDVPCHMPALPAGDVQEVVNPTP